MRRWAAVLLVVVLAAACGGGGGKSATSASSGGSGASGSSSSNDTGGDEDETYVGTIDGTKAAVAIVANNRKAIAYVCDGDHIGETVDLTVSGGKFAAESNGVTVSGTFAGNTLKGKVTLDGTEHPFNAPLAKGAGGWYRSDNATIDGADTSAGWVVLNDGSQVGTFTIAGKAAAAAPLQKGASTNGTVTFRPALRHSVSEPLPATVLISSDGDVDTTGSTTTALLTGAGHKAHWTKEGTDDSFVTIDATALRGLGVGLTDSKGAPVDGVVLARDGFLANINGQTVVPGTGWALLQSLDTSGDGKLSPDDPAFGALGRFTDADADGQIAPAELKAFGETVAALPLGLGTDKTDAVGNIAAAAKWIDKAGTERAAAAIRLKGL